MAFDTPTSSADLSGKLVNLSSRWARSSQEAMDSTEWQVAAWKQLTSIGRMSNNWDGYGASAISGDLCMFVGNALNQFMSPLDPCPYIVPSSTSGIQVEWHQKAWELEIHFDAPYEASGLFVHRESGEEIEFNLEGDFSVIRSILDDVRMGNVRAAAERLAA